MPDELDDNTILKLKDICISFNGVRVLKNAWFSLKKNEIHAIVGKNGAGKSSFMKVVTGIYTPDSGEIIIDGTSLKSGLTHRVLKSGISMVYQDLSLVPSLTVSQNIFLSVHPYKKYGVLQDKKADLAAGKILERIGAGSISVNTEVGKLSVGEAQLVEIAKAMSSNPKIIIFDEPTASLSDIEISQLFTTIKTLQKRGVSIIYITHYLEDVMKICDSVTTLRNGEVITCEKVSETSVKKIVGHMLGREEGLKTQKHSSNKTIGRKKLIELVEAKTKNVGPISLYVCEGEIIGLAGLLGSGRSEILRLLYGLDILESGHIFVNENPVTLRHPKKANKYGISLVPEERRTQGLVLDFSVEDNVSMSILAQLKNRFLLSETKKVSIVEKSIKTLDIKTNSRKQNVRFLSGGNQQKVVIGKCLVSNPKILLLDDPTFGVDIHAKAEIMQIIKNFAEQGNAVLFVSSEFSEIAHFCTRTYIVKKQKITKEVDRQTTTEKTLLREVQ